MSRTFVLLMLENRSFDHMLGHLSLEGINSRVKGLTKPLAGRDEYRNFYGGQLFDPWVRDLDRPLSGDLPHDAPDVEKQLARVRNQAKGPLTMTGFVRAYAESPHSGLPDGANPGPDAEPMGVFPSRLVPITSFLAQNFCVCDYWFTPIPTSTQPNRTIGFTGKTEIADTRVRDFILNGLTIPTDTIVFDWLNDNHIPWRVFYESLPFFLLYRRAWPYMKEPHFAPLNRLAAYWRQPPAEDDPKVVIIEPTFESALLPGAQGDDNHAPLPISFGENLLRHVYDVLVSNPARWAETVFVVYYDEHGGFWDHVPPPRIPYKVVRDGAVVQRFESMGPRIPGLVVSPWVEPGSICNALLDHTSVLQMLADEFTPGQPYSADVEKRIGQGIESLSRALVRQSPRTEIPISPTHPLAAAVQLGGERRLDEVGASFYAAGKGFRQQHPSAAHTLFPELFLM